MKRSSQEYPSSVLLIHKPDRVLEDLAEILAAQGVLVRKAATAEEALQAMDPQNPPGLIITDLILPDTDSFRLSRLLQGEEYHAFRDVPLLIVSSSITESEPARHFPISQHTCLVSRTNPVKLAENITRLQKGTLHVHRVLVVEDTPATTAVVRKILESKNFIVDTSENAHDALEAFMNQAYDTVILDYHLPDQNGDYLLTQMQETQPDCVFLVMTSNPEPQLAARLMQLGASGYLHKPFAPDYLLQLYTRAHREKNLVRIEQLLLHSNQKLQENSEQLGAVLSAMPDILFRVNRSGRFLDFHANRSEQLLAPPEKFLNKAMSEILPPELAKQAEASVLKALQTGNLQTYEYALDLPEGTTFFEARVVPRSPDEALIIVRNITQQEIARRALAESELKFRTLLEQVADILVLHDLEGNIVDVNRAAARITGYSRLELLGMKITDLDPDSEIRADADQIWQTLTPDSHPVKIESQLKRKNGERFPAEIILSSVHLENGSFVFALARDITEQKRAEQALRQSEEKYRSLTDTTIDWVFQTDENARFTNVSPNIHSILGYTVGEVLGKTPYEFMTESEAQRAAMLFENAASSQEKVLAVESAILHKNGEPVSFETNAVPLFNESGILSGYFGTCRNISDRKEAENSLLQREAELRHAQSVAHVGSWQFDLNSGMAIASDEARRIYGITSTEFSIADAQQIPMPEYRSLLDQAMKDLIQEGKPYDIQFRIRRKTDGVQRVIHSMAEYDSARKRIIGTIQDITERVEAQQALRENEQLLRTIADNFPHSYLSIIEKDLRIGFTSGQEIKNAGIDPKQFEGMTLEEIFGDNVEALRSHYLETFSGHPVTFELQFDGQDQLYRTVPLPDEQGEITRILVVVEDITEQKRAAREKEHRLQRRQRQAEVLAEAGTSAHLVEGHIDALAQQITKGAASALETDWVGVWLFEDNETRIRNVTHFDSRSGRHSRKPDLHEEVLPEKFATLKESKYINTDNIKIDPVIHFDHDGYLKKNDISSVLDAVIRSGNQTLGSLSFEYTGDPHHWEEDEIEFACQLADQFALALSNRDRRRAEAERERLIQGIEQSGEVFVITDADGAIQYVNHAFEAVTGYTREEVLGQNPRLLKSGKQDGEFYERLWSHLIEGNTWEGQLINKKKDQSLYTESAAISPVFDSAGAIINYVAVKRDISEQLRLQQEKERIEEQNLHTQRVEAIGRLAGGIAHDLNNLLTPILLHAEMMLEDAPEEEHRNSPAHEIMKAGTRARDLVNQLLAFSRKQRLDYRPLDLNTTLLDFFSLLRRTIREDIVIETSFGSLNCSINADRSQIEQVIMNLAVNAQDAMPDGGQLLLETDLIEFDEEFCKNHPGAEPGLYVMLAVSDTGTGMDTLTRQRMFEPFFSTKGEYGTGLGLATVYGIIKQHGGNIWVYSEPGHGSTFKVYLPAHETGQPEIETPPEKPGEFTGTETILLVEDNHQVRSLTHSILEKQGYQVLTAENGEQALQMLAAHQTRVHLLLTDVVMPQMNGHELYRKALQLEPTMKVLYMSGYSNDVIAHRGILEEDIALIQKPFTIETLSNKVRGILGDDHSSISSSS